MANKLPWGEHLHKNPIVHVDVVKRWNEIPSSEIEHKESSLTGNTTIADAYAFSLVRLERETDRSHQLFSTI